MRRNLTLIALVISGGCIYNLSYLRGSFESSMLEAFGVSSGELSSISAVLGAASLICYFPGGWLADRAQSRTLLTASCVLTGLGGLYMSLIASGVTRSLGSSYHQLLALHTFWAVTTIFTYWAALIKATQAWGGSSQGAAFGLLESGRGLVKVLLMTLSISLFSRHAQVSLGLSDAILVHAIACLMSGVACWLWVPLDEVGEADQDHTQDHTQHRALDDLVTLLKLPTVWLMGLIIFMAYSTYWSTFTFARYAEERYALTREQSAYVSTISMWIRALMPLVAGVLADQLGRSRVVSISFLICAVAFSAFALTPGDPELVWALLGVVIVISIGVFALRGVYFALLKGTEIPDHLAGLAVGVVSLIGFTPDIFVPLYQDLLRDHYTVDGVTQPECYQLFYGTLSTLSLIGLCSTWALMRRTERLQQVRLARS